MHSSRTFFVAVIFALAACSSHSQYQLETAFPNLTFTRPVDLQPPGDDTDRIFVVEQAGVIKVFENSSTINSAGIFLDIRDKVNDSGNEEGLLGLAFHPDYKNNGYFYVNYTAFDQSQNRRYTVIARYHVSTDPNQADKSSELLLLTFDQPYANHNGGQLAFGPKDGYLYIATGDGGSGGDPQGNGQSLRTLLGKILRIDVNDTTGGKTYGIPGDNPYANDTSGIRREVFAYGLRNPWRFSIDPVTGWIWAGDVGQNKREEVDIIEKGKNYGWNLMEGNLCYPSGNPCDLPGLVKPIVDYGRDLGFSITGGYVYRGTKVPELVGAYIYGDYGSGRIWSLRYDGANSPVNIELRDTNLNIASFGVDKNGELYICAFDGKIYRFRSTVTSVNQNALPPSSNQLAQNYPNPFWNGGQAHSSGNSVTTIQYTLAATTHVGMSIYNLQGQLVRHLLNENQISGEHTITWDGRDEEGKILPSGAYFYRLQIGDELVATKRLILLK